MGTRGSFGFRKNENDYLGYNHYDSCPEGLGNEILTFLKDKDIEYLNNFFNELKNGTEEVWDWDKHCPVKNYSIDNSFILDSLFCEYAYIINLDQNVLEFYIGFNKDKNEMGRYAKETIDEEEKYYGCVLTQKIPLNGLFENKYKVFEKGFEIK